MTQWYFRISLYRSSFSQRFHVLQLLQSGAYSKVRESDLLVAFTLNEKQNFFSF